MRLRAHEHCISSTHIGGKGGPCPSSLHTTLEGPTEYVNARWMYKPTWIPTWHQVDRVSWSIGLFSNTFFGGGPNTKLDWEIMALLNLTTIDLFYFIMFEDPKCIKVH
jgi:hypothetical protein